MWVNRCILSVATSIKMQCCCILFISLIMWIRCAFFLLVIYQYEVISLLLPLGSACARVEVCCIILSCHSSKIIGEAVTDSATCLCVLEGNTQGCKGAMLEGASPVLFWLVWIKHPNPGICCSGIIHSSFFLSESVVESPNPRDIKLLHLIILKFNSCSCCAYCCCCSVLGSGGTRTH